MQPIVAPFPAARLRRNRATPSVRDLVRENYLAAGDLIWPVFVRDGEGVEESTRREVCPTQKALEMSPVTLTRSRLTYACVPRRPTADAKRPS